MLQRNVLASLARQPQLFIGRGVLLKCASVGPADARKAPLFSKPASGTAAATTLCVSRCVLGLSGCKQLSNVANRGTWIPGKPRAAAKDAPAGEGLGSLKRRVGVSKKRRKGGLSGLLFIFRSSAATSLLQGEALKVRMDSALQVLNLQSSQMRLAELESSASEASLWTNPTQAQTLISQMNSLRSKFAVCSMPPSSPQFRSMVALQSCCVGLKSSPQPECKAKWMMWHLLLSCWRRPR